MGSRLVMVQQSEVRLDVCAGSSGRMVAEALSKSDGDCMAVVLLRLPFAD
jgi:hypothetical protein